MEAVTWIFTHKGEMLELYLGLIGIASIIIKLTPTVRDDNVLKGFLKFMGKYLALNRK